jgi:hypothetical protein
MRMLRIMLLPGIKERNPTFRGFSKMWKLFQGLVAFAVTCCAIHYEWTPNPYLIGTVSIGAAFIATWVLVRLLSLFRGRSPELRNQPACDHGGAVGSRWDTRREFQRFAPSGTCDDSRKLIEILPKAP